MGTEELFKAIKEASDKIHEKTLRSSDNWLATTEESADMFNEKWKTAKRQHNKEVHGKDNL